MADSLVGAAGPDGPGTTLLDRVEFLRLDAARRLDDTRRANLGQFLTPAPVARFMAAMLDCPSPWVRILDPGAGVGTLFAACVAELCQRPKRPARISATA